MSNHRNHNILGEYCWTCRQSTVAGVPGWPRPSRDDGPKPIALLPTSVVWADGTEDTERICSECTQMNCKLPTHKEKYMEVIHVVAM